MRIGVVTIPSAAETGPGVIEHVTAVAGQVEALGLHGVWVTDAFARGKPTLAKCPFAQPLQVWRGQRLDA